MSMESTSMIFKVLVHGISLQPCKGCAGVLAMRRCSQQALREFLD